MESDLLDPFNAEKKTPSDNPAVNPFDHPEMQALDDQLDAIARDHEIPYTPGSETPAAQEMAGAASNFIQSNAKKDPELKNLAKIDEIPKKTKGNGRVSKFVGSMSKAKQRALIAIASLLSLGALAFVVFMLFMLISGFSVKQVAEVMNIANYSRLHYSSYRRTSQMLAERSLNPNVDEFKVSAQSKTLFDRFSRFDPNEALANLRQEGELAFVTKDGTRKRFGVIGKDISTTDLDYIQIGKGGGGVPTASKWNPLQNYREQKEFLKGIQEGIESSEILAGESRLYRTQVFNAVVDASDIKLYRFAQKGRTIRTFKDAVLTAYERVNEKVGNFRGTNPDISESADNFEDEFASALDKGAPSGSAAAADATEEITTGLKNNPAKAFARNTSLAVVAATTYCTARDYVKATDENAKEKAEAYKTAGALRMSAADQIESGETTAKATMMEAKLLDGFDQSPDYQIDVGNPKAASLGSGLDASEAPVPDTDSKLYKFFNGIVVGVDAISLSNIIGRVDPTGLTGKADSVIRDEACQKLNSTPGQVIVTIGENALGVVLAGATGGGSGAAQQGILASLKSGLSSVVTRQGATKIAKGVAFDAALFLTVDAGLKMITNQSANPVADDAPKSYSKSTLGNHLIANDIAYGYGGRELSNAEVSELNTKIKQERALALHKKPLWERLASLSDPLSPASQAVATLPSSPSSLKNKSLQFASKSLNPLAVIGGNASRIASAASGSDEVFASNTSERWSQLKIPTIGWSASETEKMLEPDYWPLANGKYVDEHPDEFAELKQCFVPLTESVTPKCGNDKLSTEAGFRARLYQLDGGNSSGSEAKADYGGGILGGLLSLQEITK